MQNQKPNILFLQCDQLRNDHVGWSSRSRMATPHFDRIAEGMAFSRCLTANPICTPARCAQLTGRYTRQIHMLRMAGDLSHDIPTYPQALQKAGYRTAGIGKFHWLQTWPWGTPRGQGLDLVSLADELKRYGFDHVWECGGKQLAVQNTCDYAAHLQSKGLLEPYRDFIQSEGKNSNEARFVEFTGEPWPFDEAEYPDIVTADKMLDWLDQQTDADTPFFLFGSFVSPHPPLDPPARYLDQIPYEEVDDFILGDDETPLDPDTKKHMWKLRRAYKAMIRLVDDQVGRIFEKLEEMQILDNTVIFFVSDHGEMLGDHGRFQKSIHWHPSAVVPCAIRHPDHLSGNVCAHPMELTDLTATILECAGLDPHPALSKPWPGFQDIIPGRSLLPVLRGETEHIREYAFSECQNDWSMLHSERYAYVRHHHGEPDHKVEQLFDLLNDPDECHNLASDPAHADILSWHRNRLFHVIETYPPVQTRWAPYGQHSP